MFCFVCASVAGAQEQRRLVSPVLIVESEQMFRQSAFGKRVAAEIEQGTQLLQEENRRIETELEAEELALTEERDSLDRVDFRDKADAFDEKVRQIRAEQLSKARALQRRAEQIPPAFLTAAAPVLEQMMRQSGAAVILERRNVFLSVTFIDITQEAIARIDAEIGDGAHLEQPSSNTPITDD